MSIKIGSADPSAIKIGSADATAVYAGTEQVWPTGPQPGQEYTSSVGSLQTANSSGVVVYTNGPTGFDVGPAHMVVLLPKGTNNVMPPFYWHYTINYGAIPRDAKLTFGVLQVADNTPETFPTGSGYGMYTNVDSTGNNDILSANNTVGSVGSSYYRDINDQWVYTDNLRNGGTWSGIFRKTSSTTWYDGTTSQYTRLGFRFNASGGRIPLYNFSIKAVPTTYREGDEELAIEQDEFQRQIDEMNRQIEEALLNG